VSDADSSIPTEKAKPFSVVLRALGFLLSFVVAVAAAFMAVILSTNKIWGPDIGLGVAFAVFIAIPIALLLALVVVRVAFKGESPAFRATVFPFITAGLAAILGPAVIAVTLWLV